VTCPFKAAQCNALRPKLVVADVLAPSPGIDPQSFYSPNAAGQHGQVQSAVLLFVQLLQNLLPPIEGHYGFDHHRVT